MYNLDVAIADTFYVGEGQWLVHNCTVSLSTVRNLQNLGLDEFNRRELLSGRGAGWQIASSGGDPIIMGAQVIDGELFVGIISVSNPNNPAGALADFSKARTTAFEMARTLGYSQVKFFGGAVINDDIAATMQRVGMTNRQTVDVPAAGGGGKMDIGWRIFNVPTRR